MSYQSKLILLAIVVILALKFMNLYIGDTSLVNKRPYNLYKDKQIWSPTHRHDSDTYDNEDVTSNQQFDYSYQANKTSSTKTTSHQIKVILLSYMRSGSSLTADIIQQSVYSFYVFEPLWTTEKFYLGQLPDYSYKLISNSTLRVPKSREELTMRYNQVLDSFLNCRLEEIDVSTLTQYFMNLSRSTEDFLECAVDDTNLTRISLCIKPLITACQNSQVVVLKVIRSRMQDIRSIFGEDPHVKIIHLIRDPRGALKSQLKVGVFKWDETSKAARKLCQRIENDISISRKLAQIYPNKIMTVRYEDITDFPLQTTQLIYTFLNLEHSIDIEKYVWNITYGGYPDGCIICTNRSNATETANSWRRKLSLSSALAIQKGCKNVFKILGYRNFNSTKDIRNLLIPAQYRFYSNDYMKEGNMTRYKNK